MAFNPSGRDLHHDVPLTNILLAYSNLGYIADQIFPIVEVQKQSDLIPEFDKSPWFRDVARIRAPRTKSEGTGFTVNKDRTYFCPRYSFRYEISDDDKDNQDSIWNLERSGVEFVGDKMFMRREVAFATDFFKAGVWTGDVAGGTDFTQWSDYASSQPLIDIDGWADTVEMRIGRAPNKMVMGKQVWSSVKWHPDMVDLIKYTQRGIITQELFQSMAEVPQLLIGRAIYTTDPEGTAEANVTYSRLWGKKVWYGYVPERASIMTPAAGYTFVWARVANALQYIKRMRDEERETDIIEGNSYFDQNVTGAGAAQFADTVVV